MENSNSNEKLNKIKRKRQVTTAYNKWNEVEKHKLINLRLQYNEMFTGKNSNQRDTWRKISKQLNKPPALCRQQWQALIRKYKSLTAQQQSGSGKGDEAPEGDIGAPYSWPFFDVLHKYGSNKDNFNPPHTSCSVEGIIDVPTFMDSSDDELVINEENSMPGPSNDFTISAPLSNRLPTPSSPTNCSRPSSGSSSSRSRATPRKKKKIDDALLKESRKIGNKISSALAIYGQIVQKEYPDIDVSTLLISESDDST